MSSKYSIFFIGAGNLASGLAPALEKAGHNITGIYGRDPEKAGALAGRLYGTLAYSEKDFRDIKADVFFLAVPDDRIPVLLKEFKFPDQAAVVHCSGTASIDLLSGLKSRKGVFYPVQTFTEGVMPDFSQIPIVLESDDAETEKQLTEIAAGMTGKIFFLNSERRKYLHLAAVFANNFTNHLIGLAKEILKENRIEPSILDALVLETASKATTGDPFELQTGPARRGDEETIAKHLQMLNKFPDLWEIYEVITNSIRKR